MKSFIVKTFVGLMVFTNCYGTISVVSPTSEWEPIAMRGAGIPDAPNDEQANSLDLDFVGDATHPSFYSGYDANTGMVGFRLRVAGDQSPAGFSGQLWVGADVDGDQALDFFIGTDGVNITFNDDGGGANISPNTTTINSTAQATIPVSIGVNFGFDAVTLSLDPTATNFNLDADTKNTTDRFITFIVPFNSFASAAIALSSLTTFDLSSSIAYVAATAQNSNALNSDLNGPNGGINSTDSWETLGSISPELTADGNPVNVPETASTALLLGFAGLLFLFVHKRHQ